VQASKTRKPTTCNFDFAGRMTEVTQLGAIAARTARLLEYDAQRIADYE